jgi:hypothetical protein
MQNVSSTSTVLKRSTLKIAEIQEMQQQLKEKAGKVNELESMVADQSSKYY